MSDWFKSFTSIFGNQINPPSDAPPVKETAPVAVPPVLTGGCYTSKRSKKSKKKGGKGKKRSYKKKVYRQGG